MVFRIVKIAPTATMPYDRFDIYDDTKICSEGDEWADWIGTVAHKKIAEALIAVLEVQERQSHIEATTTFFEKLTNGVAQSQTVVANVFLLGTYVPQVKGMHIAVVADKVRSSYDCDPGIMRISEVRNWPLREEVGVAVNINTTAETDYLNPRPPGAVCLATQELEMAALELMQRSLAQVGG